MKKKSDKDVNFLDISKNNIPVETSKKKKFKGDVALNCTKFSVCPSPLLESTGDLATEEEIKSKKHKMSKPKKSEHSVCNEKSDINDEKGSPPRKKHRKIECLDAKGYKPGMLSDFLQKKKYGHLILPWETSFGRDQPSDVLFSEDNSEQKIKLKINPLFDISKRKEDKIVSTTSIHFSVFVGNLPHEVTVNQVKKIFKKFGNTIRKIKIRSGEKKKNIICASNQNFATNDRKNALVQFTSPESYEAALKMNGKLYNGHHLRVTGAQGATSSDPEKSVFVGNLALGMSDDDLWKTFENCGEIDSVRIIKDKLNKKGYFGYVNFKSPESVSEALELDGTSILDRDIRVSRIRSNTDSLSNSIKVKRKSKKRTKPHLQASNNGIESSIDTVAHEERQKKTRKLSRNITSSDLQEKTESGVSKKKNKKKMKTKAAADGSSF